MASSQISRADRKQVYQSLQVRNIFNQPRYAQLRRVKKIREVVNQHHLSVWFYSTAKLVQILRSLLEDRIFEFRHFAQDAFPELFQSTKLPDTAPSNQFSKAPSSAVSSVAMGIQEAVETELLPALKHALATGTYSDLIISGGKHYHVHKVIVCSRSDALAALCKHKLPQANVPGRKPCEGESVGYCDSKSIAASTNSTEPTAITLDLAPHDPRAVDCMVQYFYHLDYQPPHADFPLDIGKTEEEVISTGEPSDILLHTRVFILAETYAINGLKSLALRKLKTAVQEITDVDGFLVATHEAYTEAPDFETGLRDVMVAAFCKHHSKLLASSKTKDLMRSNGSLGFDIYQYSHRETSFSF